MATIIGVRSSSFKGNDGSEIAGKTIYFTEPIEADKGDGVSADRVFLTTDKLLKCQYDPQVGDDVHIEYNKYGKCSGIYPED